ncbi:MAG: cell division protein FtsH, partial [Selenomonas sp.]|nr:cell division protein FtsH [Selenomonas sp.]
SEEVASEIDKEVRKYLEEAYEACRQIITEHRDKLELIAQALMERENLTAKQLEELLETGKISEEDTKEPPKDDNNGPKDGDPALIPPTTLVQQAQNEALDAEAEKEKETVSVGEPVENVREPKFNVTHYDK